MLLLLVKEWYYKNFINNIVWPSSRQSAFFNNGWPGFLL